MHISILTLFPDILANSLAYSIVKRAQDKKLLTLSFINIRDFAETSYKTVDDHPYGGGTGMILRVDVVDRALSYAKNSVHATQNLSVLMDPQGTPYTQAKAQQLTSIEHLLLVCGHYEGVDERVRTLVDEEISIGDYVLTGGEIPAMVVVDSVTRLLPGVLAKDDATIHESFTKNTLEYPQYTRPDEYKGMSVPSILLSGNHKAIAEWRTQEAYNKTKKRRPDLVLR